MNVNATAEGVAIMRFTTAEPENAGDNGVASVGVGLHDAPGTAAALEDLAFVCSGAYFLGHDVLSERGSVAATLAAEAKLGCGNGVCFDGLTFFDEEKFLVPYAHDHLVFVVNCRAATYQKEREGSKERQCKRAERQHSAVESDGGLLAFGP